MKNWLILGYWNPLLYQSYGDGPGLRDITQGDNDMTGLIGGYQAGAGWDPCTGFGSPNGTELLATLRTPHAAPRQRSAAAGEVAERASPHPASSTPRSAAVEACRHLRPRADATHPERSRRGLRLRSAPARCSGVTELPCQFDHVGRERPAILSPIERPLEPMCRQRSAAQRRFLQEQPVVAVFRAVQAQKSIGRVFRVLDPLERRVIRSESKPLHDR